MSDKTISKNASFSAKQLVSKMIPSFGVSNKVAEKSKSKDSLKSSNHSLKSCAPEKFNFLLNDHEEIVEVSKDLPHEQFQEFIYQVLELSPNQDHEIILKNSKGDLMSLNSFTGNKRIGGAYEVLIQIKPDKVSLVNQIVSLGSQLPKMKEEMDAFRNDFYRVKEKFETLDMDKLSVGRYPLPLDPSQTKQSPLSKINPLYIYNRKYVFSPETLESLKSPSLDVWQFDSNELIGLLEAIFESLGLVSEFKIDRQKLLAFLYTVRDYYNPNTFHNFRHGFCVTQMMYSILNESGLVDKLKSVEKLVLTVACIGHDLDHPGYNNAYQINAKTDLAIIYNDTSPLEMHHAAVLSEILKSPKCNILSELSNTDYKHVRQGIIKCILATDMAKHGEILTQFKKYQEAGFNYEDAEHKSILLQMVIKCSDISNEVRPADVAEPWVDGLLNEFFAQSDREKAEALPNAPFMDREKVTKPNAQVGFINFVMFPLYELMGKLLPMNAFLNPIKASLSHYKNLQNK